MSDTTPAIAYLDTHRLQQAMRAGIQYVSNQREQLNRINVFPVADGDTGTNLVFTLKSLEAVNLHEFESLTDYTRQLARAAVDGARGNSGAIFAQFLQGLHEGISNPERLDAAAMSSALVKAAKSARQALAKPVKGTVLTVMQAFADAFVERQKTGEDNIGLLFEAGIECARQALADTPKQLSVLKDAGVVDAGAQGFVDFLSGIELLLSNGLAALPAATQTYELNEFDISLDHDNPEHRYCTECVIEGEAMQRQQILRELQTLDASSTVIAGSQSRLRVHTHVDRPDEVYRLCALHGEVSQQKADDMYRQLGVSQQPGRVSIVTDSGADLPDEVLDKLGIHRIALRFNFGGREFLDRISMSVADFYQHLASSDQPAQTSQPPVGDYRRIYSLLRDQHRQVLTISLAASLSGTYQAAVSATAEYDKVDVIDCRNASAGQGLLVIAAAEMAHSGASRNDIKTRLQQLIPDTTTYATTPDLRYAARGGRVPGWLAKMARWTRLQAVLQTDESGKLAPAGALLSRRDNSKALAKWLLNRLDASASYRLIIAHGNNPQAAERLQKLLQQQLPNLDACWLCETGPAVGAHAGPGVLAVGVQQWASA